MGPGRRDIAILGIVRSGGGRKAADPAPAGTGWEDDDDYDDYLNNAELDAWSAAHGRRGR